MNLDLFCIDCALCPRKCCDLDLILSADEFIRLYNADPRIIDHTTFIGYTAVIKKCPFFLNEQCQHYQIRPTVCKTYPILMRVSNTSIEYFLTTECPQVGTTLSQMTPNSIQHAKDTIVRAKESTDIFLMYAQHDARLQLCIEAFGHIEEYYRELELHSQKCEQRDETLNFRLTSIPVDAYDVVLIGFKTLYRKSLRRKFSIFDQLRRKHQDHVIL